MMFSSTATPLINRIHSFSVIMTAIFIASLITRAYSNDMDYIPKDWVDPTDMRFYDRETKSMKFSDSINQSQDSTSICRVSDVTGNLKIIEENKRYHVFIERFINRILQSANLKDRILKPGSKIVTEIPVSITAEELSKLSAHGINFQSTNLNDLDQLLSTVFSQERGFTFDALVSHFNPLQELFFSMSLEKLTIILGLVVIGIVIWMFAIRESMKRIMMFIFLMCFISGMVFNGWNMYTEAIVEQMAEKRKLIHIPDACDLKSKSWFSSFSSWFYAKDECKEFYRTMEISPLSKVTMSVVFSHTVSKMIIHPLKDLGAGIGDFLNGVSQAAPWYLQSAFLLYITVVFCIAFVFIVVIQFGGSLRLSTLFGGLTIGRETPEKNEKLLSEFKKLENYFKKQNQPIQAAAEDNIKIDYQRSKSISSFNSTKAQIHDHGEGSSHETTPEIFCNFPSLKYNPKTKSFFRRSLSNKLLINRKKYN